MDSTSEKLVERLLELYPKDVPTVRLSIPRDHPRAREFWDLAKALASAQEFASGLRTQRPELPPTMERRERDHAEREILRLLRSFVPKLDEFLEMLAEASSKPELRNPTLPELFKICGTLLPILIEEGVVPKTSVIFPPGASGLTR